MCIKEEAFCSGQKPKTECWERNLLTHSTECSRLARPLNVTAQVHTVNRDPPHRISTRNSFSPESVTMGGGLKWRICQRGQRSFFYSFANNKCIAMLRPFSIWLLFIWARAWIPGQITLLIFPTSCPAFKHEFIRVSLWRKGLNKKRSERLPAQMINALFSK